MSKISNKIMDSYMKTLTIDLKKEKIKDFYRYLDNPKYFKYDTEEEIEKTRNIWAGYAYLILIDKINESTNISVKEEEFLNVYYEQLLSKQPLNEHENQVNGLFIKYRLSKDYSFNNTIQLPLDIKSEEFKLGLDQFILTIENMVSSLYHKNFKIDASKPVLNDINHKGNTIRVSFVAMNSAYKGFLENDYNIRYALDIVKEIAKVLESEKLETVRKDEISKKAVVYTIEDYLMSKAGKKTKLANVYHSLCTKIIKNKQIVIDSNNAALSELRSLNEIFKSSIYSEIDEKIENYLNFYESTIKGMEHFISNSDFFNTKDLEEEGISKIYQMYLNGLKAMPRSKLTNVTKYFALNGEALTTVEMDSIVGIYKWQIDNVKSEVNKNKLLNEMYKVVEVIDYVEGLSYSYTIERAIRKMTTGDFNMTEILDLIASHYNDYIDMKYRVTRALSNLDNYASSGSPTKTQSLINKKKHFESILANCEIIDRSIEDNDYLKYIVSNIDPNEDVVIRSVKDHSKLITLMQELTGKGIATCEDMLEMSIEEGTPIIRGLKPGFKAFVEEAFALKGALDFKKNKKKK